MNPFKDVSFCGTFRSYQQRIIDNADKYLCDGKIHIVAAPGSGKTVLGLELIRKLGQNCIVLSPTTAIRQQWGDRFLDLFVQDKSLFDSLFSFDLHNPKAITSITYQALYSALEKVSCDDEEQTDMSDVDLFACLRNNNVKTICLDEAHHLKNEWQKALEKFVAFLDKDIKIISLTATPPYDADNNEWQRYINVCGEIDEEIFVPELVAQNTLCPHQDYVYFNFPAQQEFDSLAQHKQNVANAIESLAQLPLFATLCQKINQSFDYEQLFDDVKSNVCVLSLLKHFDMPVNQQLTKVLTTKDSLPRLTPERAEVALQFLLDGNQLCVEEKEQIIDVLKKCSAYQKRKVCLSLTEKLKKTIVSSVGKLDSIKQIAKHEYACMQQNLRMLVLTDYIKKENIQKIATAESFSSVNVVSIFETLRRANDQVNIGVLSGSLVILPNCINLSDTKHKKTPVPDTRYNVVEFFGSNHFAVSFVSKLFERGDLQILIGTKSLLGEGWDSPCINTLVLASFVGSFVLSNQMRGRAIRTDKNNPQKSANIWHLVTVEPEYLFKDKLTEKTAEFLKHDKNKIDSYDFDVLERRFDSFMGPNYTTGKIESGIERLTAIAPPYDKTGIDKINSQMLCLSSQRTNTKEKWHGLVEKTNFNVTVETSVPKDKRVPVPVFANVLLFTMLTLLECALLSAFIRGINSSRSSLTIMGLICSIVVLLLFLHFGKKLILHFNPANSIKTLCTALYRALRDCNLVNSGAIVKTEKTSDSVFVAVCLRHASVHDQNVFNTAVTEMLSPIQNPRYLLIKTNRMGKKDFSVSYACPSVIGKKKEYALVFEEELKRCLSGFAVVYTHNEQGRKLILKCRKNSYITANQKLLNKKYKVSH